MTVYLDLIWLLNVLIDFVLLQMTAFLVKAELKKWRLLAGTFLASIFIFVLFIPDFRWMYQPLGKFLYSILIVLVVFGYRRFRYFVQVLTAFYFVAFMIGGGMLALHYLLQPSTAAWTSVFSSAGVSVHSIGWFFVLLAFPFVAIFSRRRLIAVKSKQIRGKEIVTFEVRVDHRLLRGKGLVDSGNLLHDPITRTPVMIIEAAAFQNELPPGLYEAVAKDDFSVDSFGLKSPWERRIRLIPYRGAGGKNAFFLAFKPDHVIVNDGKRKESCPNIYVALSGKPLSREGEFVAILHPEMVTSLGDRSVS